jgi:hypothetical protein
MKQYLPLALILMGFLVVAAAAIYWRVSYIESD